MLLCARCIFFLLTGDDLQTARDSANSPKPATANTRRSANTRRFAKSNMPTPTHPHRPPPTRAAPQTKHAPANSPKHATANKRRFVNEAYHRKLTQTGHRKHPPPCKRSMPLLACPQLQPQTGAALQKATCPRYSPASRNRKQALLCKSNMPPQTHPNPKPLTSAVPQKKHAPAFLPKPATANTRLSANLSANRR